MSDQIKDIAAKFLNDEKMPFKNALVLGSLGLTKSTGDIASLAYGINFNQYAFNDERKGMLAEYLGYALLNWEILAQLGGFTAAEINQRFVAEWESKHQKQQASIKDLLKHLKPTVKQESTTQDKQVDREPAQVDFTHQV